MNYDMVLGMLSGAMAVVAIEGVVIFYWTFKGIKDGIFDETSENYTKKI